ncbi:MAG: diphosphomevalonate decarboxylase [Chloroflexi bacterium]|nr:diphosphomevalonate decarboxylase [Chloroflexota bacterium]
MIGSARAYSNIAFIKYWGNRDDTLRLALNGSISMNLAGLETITTVEFSSDLEQDQLSINGSDQSEGALARVSAHLDHFRRRAAIDLRASVRSTNNFPAGTGVASSASAFAALAVAADSALELHMSEKELSMYARLGSGSACRSIPAGFVEWYAGPDDASSFAESLAPPEHWNLVDLVAIVSREHKAVGSTGGHKVAPTSPLQGARVADAQRRIDWCREALLRRDFNALAEVIELDALMMHAVMMTSKPTLLYWTPATLGLIEAVRQWREKDGLPVAFTIDAGPNVHVITEASFAEEIAEGLRALPTVQEVLSGRPGGAATAIDTHLRAS